MFEEENDNKIYRLIISNGYDKNKEYMKFIEQMYSKNDFLWKESISGSYSTANKEFFEKIDVIILLAGLYNYNKETFNDLIKASENYNIPIVLVRPHGLEEVPENLEKEASTIVGWNANCIIDAIKNAIVAGENTATIGDELYKVEDPKDYLEDNNRISTYVEYLLPNGKKYKLDADILHLWLPLDDEGEPYFDDEIWKQNLEEFVSNELKSLVDTTGKVRSFKPTDEKKSVDVNPGNYGYRIDVKAELLQLTQDLSSGKNVIRKPVYENEEVSSENDGIGNSYVEIDLTRQHVWVYIDGELKIETDCVTGDVNKKYETPTGVYYLNYKRKGKTLVGEKDKNGKPEYETWVDYWMPFNGNIGLHDATWRKEFGGDIYIKNGSHGCVNLPPEKAKEIFATIEKNIPVIVYKS